jgi:glycosyltransferase involved in cell wall biosynthesis
MRVDQYIPDFAPHDAIGNHALQARRALREAGFQSEIWAERAHPPLDRESRPYTEDHSDGEGRVLLYQCSTASPMAKWLAARANGVERLVVQYHNITPAWYFVRWDREAAAAMTSAREELAMLAPRAALALADSAFNEAELAEAGYKRTEVCPPLVDLEAYHRPPDPKELSRLRNQKDKRRGGAEWLFVGRFAPNKCQHDLIGAFAAFRRLVDSRAHLTLVGATGVHRYKLALERLADQLELGRSVEMLSGLPEEALLAHWAVADVFVCMSEHEGFCVPVLEAMELGVPVVARPAGAVPETLGGAGLLVSGTDPAEVAEAVERVLQPGPAREEMVRAGRQRAAVFSLEKTSARLVEAIKGLTSA